MNDLHTPSTNRLVTSGISLDILDGVEERRLLDDISLTAEGGETVGITGPSGSGKSTFLAVVGTLQSPTAGSATLHMAGRDTPVELAGVTGRAAAQIRRDYLGIVFQQPNLLPALTVEEQLLAMTHLGTVSLGFGNSARRKQNKTKAQRLLDAVGLGDKARSRVSELSGGQQARVNLARALMNDPALLLIDEPTAALDTTAATKVTRLINELVHEKNIPALYVSHDREQLEELDRLITLVDGRITREPALMS